VAPDLRALLGPYGVCRSTDLAREVDRHTIGRWVAAGRLIRPHPGVVVLPNRFEEWPTRALAAILATGGMLSHVSALRVWRLAPDEQSIHVSVPPGRRALRARTVTVHRAQQLTADRLGPFPVTLLPRTLADSWGLAMGHRGTRRDIDVVRHAVIETLRDRRVTSAQLRAELERRPALPGRRQLIELLGLVDGGSHSELEIWGVQQVLRAPGMPRFEQQYRVILPSGTVLLDAAVPELKVAVEMDGAAFHGSAEDRERDTRRDVALAALGWVVLRFSYRRLTDDPAGCRREILRVCEARRALLLGK
jgi:very-short-patch-repair endonuclease